MSRFRCRFRLIDSPPEQITIILLYIIDLTDGFAKLDGFIEVHVDDAKLFSSFEVGDNSPALLEALENVNNWANT